MKRDLRNETRILQNYVESAVRCRSPGPHRPTRIVRVFFLFQVWHIKEPSCDALRAQRNASCSQLEAFVQDVVNEECHSGKNVTIPLGDDGSDSNIAIMYSQVRS